MSKVNLKLQHVLIIPFVLLISLAVLTTGYFTWRFSEKSILDLGQQISTQTTLRVQDKLSYYLSGANVTNSAVKLALTTDLINKDDQAGLHQYIADVVRDNKDVGTVGFGFPDGAYIGNGYAENGTLQKKLASVATGRMFYTFELPNETKIYERPNYDARVRPWFTEAKASAKPVWSSVYEMFSSNRLGITLSEAVYNKQGEFAGVVGTDVVFKDLDKQLQAMQPTKNALIFILDHKEQVIAQSTENNNTGMLLHTVAQSKNALLKKAVAYINTYPHTNKPLYGQSDITLKDDTQTYFINFLPYGHKEGLGWHIGVVIPENDFLANVNKIQSNTFWIWLLAFTSSLLVGIMVTYFINRSIKRLQYKIKGLSHDSEQAQPMAHHIKEVDDLSVAFSQMSKRLQDTYLAVKQSNEMLEDTVAERTQELRKVNNELLKLSHTDNLTQLANRRSFEELLIYHWKKLQSGEISRIAFMMCDLDFFKQYNDTYGHQAGDNCLYDVAQIIFKSIRATDLAARYGGEEFVVVMPEADLESAKRAAQNIKQLLAEKRIVHEASAVSEFVTMSIGISVADYDDISDNTSKDDLIARADKALYKAKQQGKNRFVVDSGSLG